MPTSLVDAGRRRWEGICTAWPSGPPGYALLGLLICGVALRVIATVSWWPVTTVLSDGYELYTSNPFQNPLHPAGYSGIMALIGLVTREIAVIVLLQHLIGIVSALLLFGATRRVTGSAWAGLLPAGIVLLDPDFIFLEHSIMSESWVLLAISGGLYAAVRALDQPRPYWRWPLITAGVFSLAVTIRTAALPFIPLAALALLLCQPRRSERWPIHLRSAVAVLCFSLAMILGFATANAIFGERFGLGASPGWYLYARAAQFADCAKFTQPPGTQVLCERRPASGRPGTRYYSFDPSAPAPHYFGTFGAHDGLVGSWARRAILAQPGDYLENVWDNLRGYWVPSLRPKTAPDQELDPQLAFSRGYDTSLYQAKPQGPQGPQGPLGASFAPQLLQALNRTSLESFYDPFNVHMHRTGLDFLRGWQQVVRFGATALSITTLLVFLGLAIGSRRSRVGVLLFGVGGLSLLLLPGLTANYWGRYTVPMAGPMMAAAAITIIQLWRTFKSRGR